MIELFLKSGPTRRLVCKNVETYTFVWPYLAASHVPGARPLCQWAARRGAAVCGGLRLRFNDSGSCVMVVARDYPSGAALVSMPLSLCPSVAADAATRKTAYGRGQEPVERLAELIVRHLHNYRSPYKAYLEFLHDYYNADGDAEGDGALTPRLSREVEVLYAGNAMRAMGERNAPFLSKASLQSPEERVFWVRTQELVRALEQRVPHFASKSAAWGVSMALARAVRDDEHGLTMYPLIDLCQHAYEPNTRLQVGLTSGQNRSLGVQWHDDTQPCAHLIATRDIAAGSVLTRLVDPMPAKSTREQEYWQMRWGYVPET